MKKRCLAIALLAVAACGDRSASVVATDEVKARAVEEQLLGFVFTRWEYDIPRDDPGECPEGMNITEEDFFSDEYAAVRDEVEKRWEAGDREGALALLPEDSCKNPLAWPDPGHILFEGNASLTGLDLDGVNSSAAAGGQCAHDDFVGADGTQGIDNQHWRLMGCVAGYRPDGLFDRLFDTSRLMRDRRISCVLVSSSCRATLKSLTTS